MESINCIIIIYYLNIPATLKILMQIDLRGLEAVIFSLRLTHVEHSNFDGFSFQRTD